MTVSNLDSATFFDVPEGFARVFNDDGTSYLKKLSEEEIENANKQFSGGERESEAGPIVAYDLDGQRIGTAGYRERGKPYQINTEGLLSGT